MSSRSRSIAELRQRGGGGLYLYDCPQLVGQLVANDLVDELPLMIAAVAYLLGLWLWSPAAGGKYAPLRRALVCGRVDVADCC